MNIVVSNVKGGVGKTTTAVYLAAAAAQRGRHPIVLVDADPQGSTAEWYDAEPFEGVELIEGPSVRTVTKAMNQGDGIVVVDTPPGEGAVVQAALARADAVVIPTRAGGVEPNCAVLHTEADTQQHPCRRRSARRAWAPTTRIPPWPGGTSSDPGLGSCSERATIASGLRRLSSEGWSTTGCPQESDRRCSLIPFASLTGHPGC